jgi:hypothetical protein
MKRPWWSEDNKVDFEESGLKCALWRGPLGHWCGYVGVPRSHPWYGKSYLDEVKPSSNMLGSRTSEDHGAIDLLIAALGGGDPSERLSISLCMRVHGGLTYAEDCVPCEAASALWWFGFDCAHAGDLVPSLAERDYSHEGEIYRDQQFVVSETQALAAQLARIGESK